MTKKLNLSAIVILLVTVLFTVSCTQDNDLQENKSFERKFNIKALKNSKQTTFTKNYKIGTSSNVDFINEQINLEIPVPLNDFHFAKAYNVSTTDQAAVLLIISRNSTEVVNDLPISYAIETSISFDEINLDANFLESKANLNIFVMNNINALDENDAIVTSFKANQTTSKNNSSQSTAKTDGPLTTEDGSIILMPW